MKKTFLKGILMGTSDVIPGVSGGTIALILGIYEQLINSIKNLNLTFLIKNRKENFKRMDLQFLIPLGLGMLLSIGIGSIVIPHLIETYPPIIFAFFFGLILASSKILYKRIRKHNIVGFTLAILGFILAFYIASLESIQTSHSTLTIFIAGLLAIAAMLLPGVSGSFLLLLIGQYEFLLESLKSFNLKIVFPFLAGALISFLIFTRIISYLLKKFHSITLFFLTGLMLGALRIPYNNIFYSNFNFNMFYIILTIISFILGLSIYLLEIKFLQNSATH